MTKRQRIEDIFMTIGYDIRITCLGNSVFCVYVEHIQCRTESGENARIDSTGETFSSLEEALIYAKGLHKAVMTIQNNCKLIKEEDKNGI